MLVHAIYVVFISFPLKRLFDVCGGHTALCLGRDIPFHEFISSVNDKEYVNLKMDDIVWKNEC